MGWKLTEFYQSNRTARAHKRSVTDVHQPGIIRRKNAPEDRNLATLEIPPVLFIHQHQVQVIPRREFLIDVPEGGREFESAEEEPDGDRLAYVCRAKVVQSVTAHCATPFEERKKHVPRTGAPSIISNFVIVSLSLYTFGAVPVVSLRMMDSSMCLILIRTRRK
jgi:hypothetical protein